MECEVSSLVFFLLIYGCQSVTCISCSTFNNSKNYTGFEKLILTDENLMKLEDAFFPTNSHSSVVVDVNYHFLKLPGADFIDFDMNKGNVAPHELFVVNFRWLASPINLFMRPELLGRLSLWTYSVNKTVVDLEIEVTCHIENFSIFQDNNTFDSSCSNLPLLLHQLNDMTANVSIV